MKKIIIYFLALIIFVTGCSNSNIHNKDSSSPKQSTALVEKKNEKTENFIIKELYGRGEEESIYDYMTALLKKFEIGYITLTKKQDGTCVLQLTESQIEDFKEKLNSIIKEEEDIVSSGPYATSLKIPQNYNEINIYVDSRENKYVEDIYYGESIVHIGSHLAGYYVSICNLMQILSHQEDFQLVVNKYMCNTDKFLTSYKIPFHSEGWPFPEDEFKTGVTLDEEEIEKIYKKYSDFSWCSIDMSGIDKYDFLMAVTKMTDQYKCLFTYKNKDIAEICIDENSESSFESSLDSAWKVMDREVKSHKEYNYVKVDDKRQRVEIAINKKIKQDYKIEYIYYVTTLCILSQVIVDKNSDYDYEIVLIDSDSGKVLADEHSAKKVIEILKGAK